ncbi:MAG: hypothetical protein AAGJ18_01875 [Bacteroidota bacterium]
MPKYNLTKIATYPALGGLAEADITSEMKEDGYGATCKGVYTVEKIEPHRSYGRWANSAVTWNAETKIVPKNTVMVKMGGKWRKLSKMPGWTRYRNELDVYNALLDAYDELFNTGTIGAIRKRLGESRKGILQKIKVNYLPTSPTGREIPSQWLLNDFGHKSIKYFRDKNHDGRRNNGERINAQFMHSSPHTEIWAGLGSASQTALYYDVFSAVKDPAVRSNFRQRFNNAMLQHSHGCIHIFPNDIDEMVAKGYIKKSSIVEVHAYDQKSQAALTVNRARTMNFEVHFFPMDTHVVVYKTERVRATNTRITF